MGAIRGLLSLLGRIMIATIFIMSAVGSKIPKFNDVAGAMAAEGVPQPKILLAGATAFLIVGGLSIVFGYRTRLGAFLLLVFLAAATYYFHDFWQSPADKQQAEMIQFMKNLSLMGTMVFLMANGGGPWSLDSRHAAQAAQAVDEEG